MKELQSLIRNHPYYENETIRQNLLTPVEEFLSRPSKSFRGKLVEAGYKLAQVEDSVEIEGGNHLPVGQLIVELIHSGSLIIDDIQDNSVERRGAMPAHHLYGTPLAINMGNWLYFAPVSLIEGLQLTAQQERELTRWIQRTLGNAHLGQAIDLAPKSYQMQNDELEKQCMDCIRLKTGSLTALAMGIGFLLSHQGAVPKCIETFGYQFGIALQMFDDIGNICNVDKRGNINKKFLEDFKNQRPSWAWVLAKRTGDCEFIHSICELSEKPELCSNENFLRKIEMLREAGKIKSVSFLDDTVHELKTSYTMTNAAAQYIEQLTLELKNAYI